MSSCCGWICPDCEDKVCPEFDSCACGTIRPQAKPRTAEGSPSNLKRLVMEKGVWLLPLRGEAQKCLIVDAPLPPALWTVRYESGEKRKWSKSHLRKYYMVAP